MEASKQISSVVNYSDTTLTRILELQQDYFDSGRTKELGFRLEQLRRLRASIEKFQEKIYKALKMDLGKSTRESYMTEYALILHEIRYFQKNLKSLMKQKKVSTPPYLAPARSYIYSEPLGLTLIISPWNYPMQLTLIPLIGAIAAGNCVVVKPSEISSNSATILAEIIEDAFPEEYVTTFLGGVEISTKLLAQTWGHVFFTGSTQVGKIVAKACANTLSPVTLELGGKSPVLVTDKANVNIAARRIVFGKITNAGQTCVAPDYVLVHQDVKEQLLAAIKEETKKQLGIDIQQNPEFGRIISESHFSRLIRMIDQGTVLFGGDYDAAERFISFTVVENIEEHSELANEEIFGPILPLITYQKFEDMVAHIRKHPKPLAAYFFSEDGKEIEIFREKISFGGGCINDTVIHLANGGLPFGGVGQSGIGSYHGSHSFHTFSHKKSIFQAFTWIDIPIRYLPNGYWKDKLVKLFFNL